MTDGLMVVVPPWLEPGDRLGCGRPGCKRTWRATPGGRWFALLLDGGGLSYFCPEHACPRFVAAPAGSVFVALKVG